MRIQLQIRVARKGLGITMRELAEMTGVKAFTIGKMERAKGPICSKYDMVARIIATLEKAGAVFVEEGVLFNEDAKSRCLLHPKIEKIKPMSEREKIREDWLLAHVNYSGDDCLAWPFEKNTQGYGRFPSKNGEVRFAHRRMCELVQGPIPHDKNVTAHSCGKGHLGCVHPQHVRWATYKENSADARTHKTGPYRVRTSTTSPMQLGPGEIARA